MPQIELVVPALGESISEVTLNRWLKPDGAWVRADEPVAELGTDKATQELPAPAAGKLSWRVREGETVRIGTVLAVIDTEATASAESRPADIPPLAETLPPDRSAQAEKSTVPPVTAPGIGPSSGPVPPPPLSPSPVTPRSSPAAARLLAEAQLSAAEVTGTGPGGRITKGDVLAAMAQRTPAATSAGASTLPPSPGGDGSTPGPLAPPSASASLAPSLSPPSVSAPSAGATPTGRSVTREPMSHIRRRIAERLLESQQTTATLTTFNEADMSTIIELRQRYNERFEKRHGVKLGFMSFFVKAVVEALKAFPIINARIDGQHIVYHHYYDIGVAVSTDRGLIVPVIRDADRLSFAQIESAIAELARKAREGRITLQDLEGGTFTITNGGVFGSLLSTPILNPPQSAILGMHAIQKRAVVVQDQIAIRPMMYLALSYDHRLIDGREAVQFLVRVKECIENPAVLMLDLP
ncbi:MAG: 2-oxoglutarate dehydrogenase complex dihydrolipoyllysine-residue succinyltransferase [Thermogemmata sp.]|uniref:Dihydrolipoyllysine-residue succinyltransferase component of 2-oxoglutarate dehydrogenase complex n=1 Tax=Thermogemmata fonticola TaxID=2755323 RepID=A0A7V8VC72_9BACT|nr:2-oxoglutarate dehydrogenase complex dihydrolipoyllysine-residue succinyltransferase [Thermogemmata fonticola]MBA2225350.1 2-oxoglutarate dehydrogenase complex dihydrolipoyllysine-residue succinyltransferase [Thermogemmata fonticola]GIW84796.1 MAG: dihydrolipoyllysine-residue succinyltransferase component of 2-oxoglutarate dehydrogenase complex [Gemmataceae bacterium]